MNKKITILFVISIFIGTILTPISFGYNLDTQTIENKDFKDNIFDRYINLLMKLAHKPSISACIIIKDKVVWSKSYGFYDIENKKQATKETTYLTASISKTVTATALMQLYDKGLFDLDDDVNKYLPFSFRNPNYPDIPITFRMILSHHSSLADDNLFWLCLSYIPGDPDIPDYPNPWLKEYLTPNGSAYTPNVWSKNKPGEKYYYANIGYSIIGYLIEILSGQNFNEYCKEHIFIPLQMYNTSFRLRDLTKNNIALPYEFKNGKYYPHPHYGMYVLTPAATMRTSIEEYSHFIIAHINDGVWNDVKILNKSTVELMHKVQFSPDNKYNYGLGWQITKKYFGKIELSHGGYWPGVHTIVTIRPDKNTAVIIFTNALDSKTYLSSIEKLAFNLIKNTLFMKANSYTK